ncbi:hypothetical protein [Erythrobacter sp. JK5]|uniref:hypothetical protein n=1 Tax=Erythrobacter sp. JK5 TaxID=2829500 RepID=UPI001BAC0BC5|nr:hypothetical protein [Erythrobacter sp. JK5]QUL36624.1 hypothetical protein KDC96_09250 [Erythrobacter sp. JK5]
MTFVAVSVMIFLIAFVLIGGVVMYLSRTIDHGEARFDSKTGKPLNGSGTGPRHDGPTRPATRIEDKDDDPSSSSRT